MLRFLEPQTAMLTHIRASHIRAGCEPSFPDLQWSILGFVFCRDIQEMRTEPDL